jgi:exodeoxyribonuclease VII small subunit
MAQEEPSDLSGMTFEQAMAALEAIVQKLESGQVGLEDSIAMYARGAELRRHCEAKLKAAAERVERIVAGPTGEAVAAEPASFD